MRGDHIRLLVLSKAVVDVIGDWRPPPDLADATRAAVVIMLSHALMLGGLNSTALRVVLRQLGPGTSGNAYLAAMVRILLAYDPADTSAFLDRLERLERLAGDRDRHTAGAASQWLSHERENAGDPVGAIEAAERALALASDDDGPWSRALPRTMLAELTMHVGDCAAAVEHARAALPVMRRLGASDDEIQLRVLLALCAIADGRLADAADELALADGIDQSAATFGAPAFRQFCRAELALAHGDLGAGLRLHRECAAQMRDFEFPGMVRTGAEPWTLFGSAMALCAHARHAAGADEEHGLALFRSCREGADKVFSSANERLDYPAAGMLLFALGAWSLLREAAPPEDALRLLALADRFAYNQTIPTMRWERITPAAEEAAPGRIAELRAQYRDCRPPSLLAEARGTVQRLPS